MKAGLYSQIVTRGLTFTVLTITTTIVCSDVQAQTGAGFYTDPQTGIVYRQVARTVERPVVETKIESRAQTVYRPQTVSETKPEARTVYTPVIEHKWQPRMHGRWNPFQQPTIAYHHVPETRWEARSEIVNRTNTRTEWVAETRQVDVPQQLVRMEREQKVEYEPVGRVAPPQADPPGVSNAIASRLRPLDNSTRVEPLGSTGIASSTIQFGAPRIAASTVGRMTSDPPRRNAGQGGLRATELYPTGGGVHSQALPPSTGGGVGVASMQSLPFFR